MIRLLVHLGISTPTAAGSLIFMIALYVLLKLAVVPDPSPVVDTQLAYYTVNPFAQAETLATESYTQ